MHNKIKALREALELKETDISSLLNISYYKYKNYENGSWEIPSNILLLLSIMYDIPMDYIMLSRYTLDDIISCQSIQRLSAIEKDRRTTELEKSVCNFCSYVCSYDCISVNFRTLKIILKKSLFIFSKNLYNIRQNKKYEINTVCQELAIEKKIYINYEKGLQLPDPYTLIKIANKFNVDIFSFFIHSSTIKK